MLDLRFLDSKRLVLMSLLIPLMLERVDRGLEMLSDEAWLENSAVRG
jgi:hypothetical protein